MIESEKKALSILNYLEQICSDIESLMYILRKEDCKVANALCQVLVSFFWEIENPIIINYPSLHSIVKVGAKYKDCVVYKITQYNKLSHSCCIVKSGILPKDSQKVLTEMKNKFSNNQDFIFLLSIENCFFPKNNENIPNILPSKMKFPFIIKELERICSIIESLGTCLQKEDVKLAEALYKRSADILLNIEGPIVKTYPSLRPVAMLGKKYQHYKYKVIKYDKNLNSCSIIKSAILPEDAQRVLTEVENNFNKDQNCFFYLELEDFT